MRWSFNSSSCIRGGCTQKPYTPRCKHLTYTPGVYRDCYTPGCTQIIVHLGVYSLSYTPGVYEFPVHPGCTLRTPIFGNKILGRYPDIHREFSSEKFDYYGIIDKSLCPACKSSHRDEKSIRGRYEAGSYFIKCGQQEIEITV